MRWSIVIVSLALIMAGCTVDKTEDLSINIEEDKIYASMAEEDVRVQLNDKKHTVWNKGDEIYTLYDGRLDLYRFDGESGDYDGSFSRVGAYSVEAYPDKHYAFYSYYGYGRSGNNVVIFCTLPTTQKYMRDSYGVGSNVMIGESEDGTNFRFKNVVGYLRVGITGDKSVRSIKLEGNNDESMSGIFYYYLPNITNLFWYSVEANSITIDCGESGVQLGATQTDFYYSLLPGNYPTGISLTITFTDGTTYIKRTTKPITIERNTILPMATFKASDEDVDWQRVVIKHQGTSVAAPVFTGASAMRGYIYWGDGRRSLLEEFTSYDYKDGEPSHIIEVEVEGANGFSLSSCKGVTKIDLSNF